MQNHLPVGMGELESDNSCVRYGRFKYAGHEYAVGDCVYLPCDTYKFPVKVAKPKLASHGNGPDPDDELQFPELYRKSEYIKGSNTDVPKPFQIGNDHHFCCY